MKMLLAGAFLLCGAVCFAQQQASPQLPSSTTPPTFPQTTTPDKDVGRDMPPDTRAKEPSSADVQKQIQDKLDSEPDLSADSLKVRVTDSQVVLRGNVADSQQKDAVRRIAESYAGRRKIVDKLTMKP